VSKALITFQVKQNATLLKIVFHSAQQIAELNHQARQIQWFFPSQDFSANLHFDSNNRFKRKVQRELSSNGVFRRQKIVEKARV